MKVDSAISLGPPAKTLYPEQVIAVFSPKRSMTLRWISGLAGLVFLVLGVGLFAYGGYTSYSLYFKHGPAVVSRSLFPYLLSSILALWVGVWCALAAIKRTGPRITLLEGGLEFQRDGQKVLWRWQDMASLRATLRYNVGLTRRTEHVYTLVNNDGERLALDDTLQDVQKLAEHIRARLLPIAGSRALPAFYNGTELEFGRVRVAYKSGLVYGKMHLAWENMSQAVIHDGRFTIEMDGAPKTPKRINLATDEIPNVDILLAIVQKMIASRPLPPLIPGKTSSAVNG
jgi:hypothetical protein